MQRYFIEKETLAVADELILNKEISHHMLKVMRNRTGDLIHLITSQQVIYEAEYIDENSAQAVIKIKQILPSLPTELPVEVTIACGLSKNDKLDWIVQKATECGMDSFLPISLKRDVVKWPDKKVESRIDRLQKIAQEAAQQSYRMKVPAIQPLCTFKQLKLQLGHYDHLFVAYEETAKQGDTKSLLSAHKSLKPTDRILIIFGSEGGIDPQEWIELEKMGFKSIGLGPRILRAETAPIYYLSTLSYVSDIMNSIY